jgi:hypothetical protein
MRSAPERVAGYGLLFLDIVAWASLGLKAIRAGAVRIRDERKRSLASDPGRDDLSRRRRYTGRKLAFLDGCERNMAADAITGERI